MTRVPLLAAALALAAAAPAGAISLDRLQKSIEATQKAPFGFSLRIASLTVAPGPDGVRPGVCTATGKVTAISRNGTPPLALGETVVIQASCWRKGQQPLVGNIIAVEQMQLEAGRLFTDVYTEAPGRKPRTFVWVR